MKKASYNNDYADCYWDDIDGYPCWGEVFVANEYYSDETGDCSIECACEGHMNKAMGSHGYYLLESIDDLHECLDGWKKYRGLYINKDESVIYMDTFECEDLKNIKIFAFYIPKLDDLDLPPKSCFYLVSNACECTNNKYQILKLNESLFIEDIKKRLKEELDKYSFEPKYTSIEELIEDVKNNINLTTPKGC